jgi:hypothetical protein
MSVAQKVCAVKINTCVISRLSEVWRWMELTEYQAEERSWCGLNWVSGVDVVGLNWVSGVNVV